MAKKIIGTIGKNGAGKDTVLKIIAERYNVPIISIGDMVREIAKERDIEPTRGNLNDISKGIFRDHGKDWFIRRVIQKTEALDVPLIVVTGIRTYVDVKELQDHYGPDFMLIHVRVDNDDIRLARARARGTERDPKTMEDLHRHDAREEKSFGVSKATALANYTIRNDAGLEDLHDRVDEWVEKHLPELAKR